MAREEREIFKCRYCEFTSVDRGYIRSTHEKTHMGKNFKCDQCDKSYHTKHRLKSHVLQVHENAISFQCQFCPKIYRCAEKTKEHEIVNHTKKDVRDVFCKMCTAAFVTETQLKSHIKQMHTEGPIKCEFEGCSKTFHSRAKKDVHMRSHTKENNYKCEICNRAFPYSWTLGKHKRVAHGIEKQ